MEEVAVAEQLRRGRTAVSIINNQRERERSNFGSEKQNSPPRLDQNHHPAASPLVSYRCCCCCCCQWVIF